MVSGLAQLCLVIDIMLTTLATRRRVVTSAKQAQAEPCASSGNHSSVGGPMAMAVAIPSIGFFEVGNGDDNGGEQAG